MNTAQETLMKQGNVTNTGLVTNSGIWKCQVGNVSLELFHLKANINVFNPQYPQYKLSRLLSIRFLVELVERIQ